MNASNEAVNDATLTALVTGVSSGIGRETAGLLAEQGFRVFGTARNLTTTDPIAGVELIPMDVMDDTSVADGVNFGPEGCGPESLSAQQCRLCIARGAGGDER